MELPNGTNVTALVATFVTKGKSVKVGTIAQISCNTPNDFTKDVIYTVTAENGTTTAYTVTVSVAASGKPTKVAQTGQKTSYATGDNGALQTGITWPNPRFTSGTGIKADCITDNLTGLIWTKSTSHGTWQQGLDYTNNLTLCGFSDWRLPNRKEFLSLINYGESDSSSWLLTQGFTNINSFWYWSSTNMTVAPSRAWVVSMYDGYVSTSEKDIQNFGVLPVRSGAVNAGSVDLLKTGQTVCYDDAGSIIACSSTGQDGDLQKGVPWPEPRFIWPTKSDSLSGLMWAHDAGTPSTSLCIGGIKKWRAALDYVTCLNASNYLGHNDWRMPNINELESLINADVPNPDAWLKNNFINVQSSLYWSSTAGARDGEFLAWGVSLRFGEIFTVSKQGSSHYVWPVRSAD